MHNEDPKPPPTGYDTDRKKWRSSYDFFCMSIKVDPKGLDQRSDIEKRSEISPKL